MNPYLPAIAIAAVCLVIILLVYELRLQHRDLRNVQEMPDTEGGPVYVYRDED